MQPGAERSTTIAPKDFRVFLMFHACYQKIKKKSLEDKERVGRGDLLYTGLLAVDKRNIWYSGIQDFRKNCILDLST